jgi:putative membrane protein
MHGKPVRALACTAVLLTLSLLATAQTNGKQSSKSNGNSAQQISATDRQFLDKAAQGGQAEVQLGKLAQDKSQDPKVKSFAERMVKDHSQANQKLESLASSKGVTLPTSLNAEDQKEKDRLSKLSAEQFDHAYMSYMVKDHTQDVSEFRKESESAKDPDVKQFASQTLPTLESHLQEAKSIAPKERAEAKGTSQKSGSKKGTTTSASNPPQR